MERIAVVSVALSVMVMILSLAVMIGFKREVPRKLMAFSSHVTLCERRSLHAPDASSLHRTPSLERMIRSIDGFRRMSVYACRGGIVRTPDAVEGVLLKGVDRDFDWQHFGNWLVRGSLPRVGDSIRTKDILLSENLSRKLMLDVGDKVEMLFVEGDARPRRDRFKVSGIYSSGLEEMDRRMVLTDLRNVQRLASWERDQVSGYDIMLDDGELAPRFADELNDRLFYDDAPESINLAASSIQQQFPNIFDWLKAHNVNGAVILVIMLVVAFFSMASALLVLVLERTRMIGLLKALGMGNGPIRKIFLYRSAFIVVRGLMWGNLIGGGLCLLQATTHLVRLSSEGYILSEVPVAVEAWWWLLLNAGFMVAIVLLLIVPASIVTSVKPDETIRYE